MVKVDCPRCDKQDIEEWLTDEGFEDVQIFNYPHFASAFLGVDMVTNRAIYDYGLMVEFLVISEKIDTDEAEDFISYDTLRSCTMVTKSPVILYAI